MHDTSSILTAYIYNHTCTALYMSVYIHFWHICVYTQIYMLWVYIHVLIFIYICCIFSVCVCVFVYVSVCCPVCEWCCGAKGCEPETYALI